jgi:hypothetical protein
MNTLTISITLPRAISLNRLCKALRSIGLIMSYDGANHYTLTETDESTTPP